MRLQALVLLHRPGAAWEAPPRPPRPHNQPCTALRVCEAAAARQAPSRADILLTYMAAPSNERYRQPTRPCHAASAWACNCHIGDVYSRAWGRRAWHLTPPQGVRIGARASDLGRDFFFQFVTSARWRPLFAWSCGA